MKDSDMMLWGGLAAAAAAYYFLVYTPANTPTGLTITTYDNQTHVIQVESGISAAATAQIRAFFGIGGTMQNSVNPTQDIANFVALLKSEGFSIAAASCQTLYTQLIQGGTQLASGYASGYTSGYAAGSAAGALMRHPMHISQQRFALTQQIVSHGRLVG
jgi:hypothetical protein